MTFSPVSSGRLGKVDSEVCWLLKGHGGWAGPETLPSGLNDLAPVSQGDVGRLPHKFERVSVGRLGVSGGDWNPQGVVGCRSKKSGILRRQETLKVSKQNKNSPCSGS